MNNFRVTIDTINTVKICGISYFNFVRTIEFIKDRVRSHNEKINNIGIVKLIYDDKSQT